MSRLKKFDYRIKDNRKRNTLLISICLLTIVVVGIKLYRSYAKFEVETTEYEVINGTVVEPINAVEYLTSIVDDNPNTMIVDDTPDENIRYMGANPNNYVKFNNELWRIIGVMNNVDGGVVSGDDASRVKMIRAESLGAFPYKEVCLNENMTYNSETDTWTCSSKIYNNNWQVSTVNEILNNLYWNSLEHDSYNGYMYVRNSFQYYKTENIYFRNNGLKDTAKNLIESTTYYLGGVTWNSNATYYGLTMISSKWYEAERTNEGNNNPLTWTGNLGLMYPSDYGYASSGVVNNTICHEISLNTWSQSANSNCKINNWLFNSSFWQWTMTSRSDAYNLVTDIDTGGHISGGYSTSGGFFVRPVAYLKSTVKIVAGPNSDGSYSKPYKLTL